MLELALWDRDCLLLVGWHMLANTLTKLHTGKLLPAIIPTLMFLFEET
jgi:hypothetical protein